MNIDIWKQQEYLLHLQAQWQLWWRREIAITWEVCNSLKEKFREEAVNKLKVHRGTVEGFLFGNVHSNLEMRNDTGWPPSSRLFVRADINRGERQVGVKPNGLQGILRCCGCVICGVDEWDFPGILFFTSSYEGVDRGRSYQMHNSYFKDNKSNTEGGHVTCLWAHS